MGNKIKDKFTPLNISRQRKWQLRQAQKGLCQLCDNKLHTTVFCKKHALHCRIEARKRYRVKAGIALGKRVRRTRPREF